MQDELASVEINSLVSPVTNPMDTLSERQKIALSGRWAAMKESERDQYNDHVIAGTDSATLYAIVAIQDLANSKIFSETRAVYLGTMRQWFMSLVSNEEAIRKYAEVELEKLKEQTTSTQQATLLSALKAVLLDKRTFLPEQTEKAFRAICRFFSFDVNMIK
jgi:hypothetical protein